MTTRTVRTIVTDDGDTMTVDVPDAADRLDALTDAVEALAFDMLMQQMGGA